MAYFYFLAQTDLPPGITQEIINTCEHYPTETQNATVRTTDPDTGLVNPNVRSSKVKWLPSACWVPSFIWYYIKKANEHNFMYDLTDFDDDCLQYTTYNEGDYYHWHDDHSLDNDRVKLFDFPFSSSQQNPDPYTFHSTNLVRKLSFSLLLSTPGEDFTGGQLQFHNCKGVSTPDMKLGTLIVFDSTIQHRVKKVTSGTRKSLVGWAIGPRWK